MRSPIAVLRRRASLLLLPLSVVPFVAGVPVVIAQHERFDREHNMGPLPASTASLTAVEQARLKPLPATPGEIPVLLWHGISDTRDGYSVSQSEFARQLATLKHLGYTAISAAQWAAFRAGDETGLPAKPILLTFDDGRLDSYRGADRVLQRYGMRATMFVITAQIETGDPEYLTWAELHAMADSGRWDIEPHAHEGHRTVTIAPDGTQAPFYAARKYTRSEGQETLAEWEARVSTDLFAVGDRFAEQGLTPHVFAVPFGDYGQRDGNDPAIPELLSGLITRQFGSFFIQTPASDPEFTVPGSGSAQRYVMRTETTPDLLYAWLHKHSAPPAAATTTKKTKR
jgi:poly-beta-1,6-N-acetyl-D-glucosamine N-deacetylase